jgi:hypothetical protein
MSKFLKISINDFWKGFLVAVFTAPVTMIYQSLMTNPGLFQFDWKQIIGISIAGALGYILKKILTNSEGQILTTEENMFLGIIARQSAYGIKKYR